MGESRVPKDENRIKTNLYTLLALAPDQWSVHIDLVGIIQLLLLACCIAMRMIYMVCMFGYKYTAAISILAHSQNKQRVIELVHAGV